MEWRAVRGGMDVPGPAAVWARQRVPLVDGEEPSGLQRLFAVADSGNGVSNYLDPRKWWFINSELTVHLRRPPAGEWIGLDAVTLVGKHGDRHGDEHPARRRAARWPPARRRYGATATGRGRIATHNGPASNNLRGTTDLRSAPACRSPRWSTRKAGSARPH